MPEYYMTYSTDVVASVGRAVCLPPFRHVCVSHPTCSIIQP